MALQDILKKVLEDAAQKVSVIEKETKLEIANNQKQIKVEEDEALAVLSAQHADSLSTIKSQSVAAARREQKSFQLSAKCAVLESALDVFYSYLLDLSDGDYEKIVKNLLAQISDEGVVFVPKKRLELMKKIVQKNISVEVDDSIAGGFVFKTAAMSIDNSFKNVVYSEYKTDIEKFFAEKLALI